jgi:hypothetical protein
LIPLFDGKSVELTEIHHPIHPHAPKTITMRMQEVNADGKDYVIAPLFNLCMDLFRIAVPLVRPEQQNAFREEKHRFVLWGDGFGDASLDQLFDLKSNDRYKKMVTILLGSVANLLDSCQYQIGKSVLESMVKLTMCRPQ